MKSDRRRDRLSALPDSLILEILSRLEMWYAVRTTILSKRWKDLWTTVPRLYFWCDNRNFIGGALANWKGEKIKKFALSFDDYNLPTSDTLDSWLLIPIHKQVEVLRLHVGNYMDPEYCLSQRLYSCSSFTKVSLSFCNLKIDENVDVQWNLLKRLSIQNTRYSSGDALNRIISGAPLLEDLILWCVDFTENLDIRSTSLKKLQISGEVCAESVVLPNAMLTIWAPNLLSLDISAAVYGTCLLDVPSLTDAIICFQEEGDMYGRRFDFKNNPPLQMCDQLFRSLRHVEELTLSDLSVQMLLEMKENHMVVHFSNTKFLELSVCSADAEGLLDVLGMFPELMNLVVSFDQLQHQRYTIGSESDDEALVDASNMILPSPSLLQLTTVDIAWSKCPTSIIPMVKVMLKNALVLEKMVLRFKAGRSNSEKKIFMLAKMVMMSMPRSSPIAQVIICQK